MPTTNVCEDCHSTQAWSPVTAVDHTQVVGTCQSCHNGVIAEGKPPDHIPSGNACDDCHTTDAWTPAVFDHTGVTNNCISCHDGTTATGKGPVHMPTTNVCEDCHCTTAWSPVTTVDHTQVAGTCSSCHNGTIATGKPQGHFVTSRECDYCHTTHSWTALDFHHSSPNYPGDHRANLDCNDCHGGNSEVVTYQFPQYAPDCASCHANNFESEPHRKTQTPSTHYNVDELRDCTGACHIYEDASLTTIHTFRPGPQHHVTDRGFGD